MLMSRDDLLPIALLEISCVVDLKRSRRATKTQRHYHGSERHDNLQHDFVVKKTLTSVYNNSDNFDGKLTNLGTDIASMILHYYGH